MKKKLIIVICIILIIVVGLFTYTKINSNKYTKDELKFRDEYISLNNNKKYISIDIDKDNNAIYIDSKKVISKLNKGTSVIYLGSSKINSCRNLVPILAKLSTDYSMALYYFDISSIRNDKESIDYKKIVDALDVDKINLPTVIFIKNGEITDIYKGNEDDKSLSKSDIKKVNKELEAYYDEVSTGVCEKDVKC